MEIKIGNALCVLSLVLGVAAGCAATGTPRSAMASVVAAETAIAAAGQVAMGYMTLPVCGAPGAPALCAAPSVKANIKTAFDNAYGAVTTAQADADAGKPVDTVALNAAIAALQSTVAALPKGT